MTTFAGYCEYRDAGRGAAIDGRCEVNLDAERATVATGGAPVAFDLGDVDAIAIADYEIALAFSDGSVLRLSRFGKAFETLAHQLRDAHRARLVKCLLVSDLDEVARFEGSFDGSGLRRTLAGRGEIRLYESNVAFLPETGGGFQWRLADVAGVDFDDRDYAVVVRTRDEVLRIGRLAKRTRELAESITGQIAALGARAARALHQVLPFLSPSQFIQVSAAMREGTSTPLHVLRAIDARIEAHLLTHLVDPSLRPYVESLLARTTADHAYVGWKIVRPEIAARAGAREAASEETADAAIVGDAPGSTVAAEDAAVILDVGDGLEAIVWFLFPLPGSGHLPCLAWETTSRDGRATYVFAGDSTADLASSVTSLTRELLAVNFRRAPIHLSADALAATAAYRHYAIAARRVPELSDLRRRFVGRAIHTSVPAWDAQIDRLVAAVPSGSAGAR